MPPEFMQILSSSYRVASSSRHSLELGSVKIKLIIIIIVVISSTTISSIRLPTGGIVESFISHREKSHIAIYLPSFFLQMIFR
jgi:hypothetical protein